MNTSNSAIETGKTSPIEWFNEKLPYLVVPLIILLALPLIGGLPTWVTLTLAGLAMGMMIFTMASGLSLVFGLMDVLNFGHGAFITFGAFVASSFVIPFSGWLQVDSFAQNLAALLTIMLIAVAVGSALGLAFEKVVVAPVYGDHLKQILITMGAVIVAEQMIPVIWGGAPVSMPKPASLNGVLVFGEIAFEKYRLFAFFVGVVVYLGLYLTLTRTRIGLLVRAGVENREMVEALGYRIDFLFIGVFVAGSALAALGGTLWGFYSELITASVGSEIMILVFIVVIIGGLGSVPGSLIGALLVGLVANYMGFLFPKLALGSNILLMLIILLWRPNGLFPVNKH